MTVGVYKLLVCLFSYARPAVICIYCSGRWAGEEFTRNAGSDDRIAIMRFFRRELCVLLSNGECLFNYKAL